MEELTVSVRDGMFTTHLLKGGSGRPLVVLHGAGGLRPGTPWIEELTKSHTVYAPWHPGFGASEGLDHLDDIHDLVVYYQDLFDALGLERPDLLGSSFGGMIAAEIAAHCSAAVNKLILVAPLGLWRDDAPIADIFTLDPEQTAELAFHDPQSAAGRQFATLPEDPDARGEAIIARTASLAATGKFVWPIPDKGLKKRIHRITAPTLLLWGESDRLVPPVYAEEFHRRIPGSRVTILKEAGHVLGAEKPAELVTAVREFLG